MSKRVIDDNGAPRNLVEVPTPINQNARPFDQQQPPFNNSNNNINNQFGNNNNYNQQNGFGNNDNFSIVPRIGPKKKTIIIKDEKGNEISRITSSTGSGFSGNLLPRSNSFVTANQYQIAPINPYPVVQPQYMVQCKVSNKPM
jgi:hypothetical protein